MEAKSGIDDPVLGAQCSVTRCNGISFTCAGILVETGIEGTLVKSETVGWGVASIFRQLAQRVYRARHPT